MNPKVSHLRDVNGHPYGTVAYSVDTSGITYGIAICHPHDNFRKKVGRMKAVGRYTSNKFCKEICIEGAENMPHDDVINTIVLDYKLTTNTDKLFD